MKKLLLTIIILILLSMVSCGDLPDSFKVIYHSNGSTDGYPPNDNNKYKSGEFATVLDHGTLINTETSFAGWNTNKDNKGTHYNSGDQIEIKKIDIFLFPVWE